MEYTPISLDNNSYDTFSVQPIIEHFRINDKAAIILSDMIKFLPNECWQLICMHLVILDMQDGEQIKYKSILSLGQVAKNCYSNIFQFCYPYIIIDKVKMIAINYDFDVDGMIPLYTLLDCTKRMDKLYQNLYQQNAIKMLRTNMSKVITLEQIYKILGDGKSSCDYNSLVTTHDHHYLCNIYEYDMVSCCCCSIYKQILFDIMGTILFCPIVSVCIPFICCHACYRSVLGNTCLCTSYEEKNKCKICNFNRKEAFKFYSNSRNSEK